MDAERFYMVLLGFETFFDIVKCSEAFSWVLRSSKAFLNCLKCFSDVGEFSKAF